MNGALIAMQTAFLACSAHLDTKLIYDSITNYGTEVASLIELQPSNYHNCPYI